MNLKSQRGEATGPELIACAIIVLMLVAGKFAFSAYRCHSQAGAMGLKCNWGPIQGCVIETKSGTRVPLDKYRYMGD